VFRTGGHREHGFKDGQLPGPVKRRTLILNKYVKWIPLIGGGAIWFFIVMILTYIVFKTIHI